jgi:serine/threonine-protein kinase
MIGTKLGNWVIDKELGRGGMGQVYLAHEDGAAASEGRQVAVKVLAPELAQELGFVERFQREIDTLKQLSHPHIVRFFDSGYQEGRYFYAMEYVQGSNFEDVIRERGRLPWREVLDIALQISPALKHAHDHGVIHRDIKPQNLLRAPDGTAKLTDFGIAKVFAAKQLTATGGLVGTAEYLSPEQAAGKPVSNRSDLYSFGVVLYLLLTGRPPFVGRSVLDLLHKHRFGQFDPPQRVVPDIPPDLDKIVCGLLEKDPSGRPANGQILQRQLEVLRSKIERREQHTVDSFHIDQTQTDGELPSKETPRSDDAGPATLMSRLMRRELISQQKGGALTQFLNRPVVLFAMFAGCVALIVWGVWLRPKTEESAPGLADAPLISEAQRFYQQGRRLNREGDPFAARAVWQNLVRVFQGIDSEQEWVNKAKIELAKLQNLPEEHRWDSVRQALERARDLRDKGKRQEAEKVWQGIEDFYRDNPSAREILQELQHDRAATTPARSANKDPDTNPKR